MNKIIGVIGSSAADAGLEALAEAVGREIGRSGCSLVCGGLGGVMTAACRGMKRLSPPAAGITIGILPGTEKGEANPFVDLVIPSGIGFARNTIITLTADGVVAVGGGAGTLTEIAYAWKFGRPIAVVVPGGGWADVMGERRIDETRTDTVMRAPDPESAVRMILEKL
jgi:uncharacterized protein (TIGR00725 family)